MSGGSYNYAFEHVARMAADMSGRREAESPSPAREWFIEHLRRVAEAMRAVEWVDSFDYSPGDEDAPIYAVAASASECANLQDWRRRALKAKRDRLAAELAEVDASLASGDDQ